MRTVLALALATALAAPVAYAGTPFGGDDTGFVPPDKVAYGCESKVAGANAKLRRAITKCHVDLASQRLKGSNFNDDGCETAAKAKFDAYLNKVFGPNSCPACLVANTTGMSDAVESELDASNGDFYCDGSEPFGDDDTGFVPPDPVVFKCEATVAKNIAKLNQCIDKCHKKMAAYALKGAPFDEEACESDPLKSCLSKYNKVRDKVLPFCPPCLDQTTQDQLAADTEDAADANLGTFYCASPSGAFIDALY
jgi:hypothetical protein